MTSTRARMTIVAAVLFGIGITPPGSASAGHMPVEVSTQTSLGAQQAPTTLTPGDQSTTTDPERTTTTEPDETTTTEPDETTTTTTDNGGPGPPTSTDDPPPATIAWILAGALVVAAVVYMLQRGRTPITGPSTEDDTTET